MTTQRWRQIEEILAAALEVGPERRPRLIAEQCGADGDLRSEVESLLACDGKGEGFLQTTIQREAVQLSETQAAQAIGRCLGHYRITGVVGRGGMGTVYLAVRDDEAFDKQVAIKVIKRGMDTDDVVARFRTERHILARLEHPNIARLLDGGTTDDGLPYLVMEYVEGKRLLDHAAGLPIPDKLRLFRQICNAVQYAHQNLVVHRDLKPANVLVTDEGIPKLLDFGIAKLLTPDTRQTVTGLRLLTPDYASPEQLLGKPVTTASDIYSLGAVLYEMLTGRRARYDRDPQRPGAIDKRLSGDLDNIVLMALRKEPERRYATVEQLSDDIRRYLEGLTVSARKDTLFYRTGKLVRRNKLAVAAALFAWAALATGAAVAWYQKGRAEREYREAREYANSIMTGAIDTVRMMPGGLATNRNLSERSLAYLERAAEVRPTDPEARFELALGHFRMAQVYFHVAAPNLLQHEKALEYLHKARAIVEQLYQVQPAKPELVAFIAAIYHHIGATFSESGRFDEAWEWYRRAGPYIERSDPKMYRSVGYPAVPGLRASALADIYLGRRDYREVQRTVSTKGDGGFTRTIAALIGMGSLDEARRMLLGREHRRQITYMGRTMALDWDRSLSRIEWRLGNSAEAVKLARATCGEVERLRDLDIGDPFAAIVTAVHRWHLASLLRDSAPKEAANLYSRAISMTETILKKSPRNVRFQRDLILMRAQAALPLRKLGDTAGAHESLQKTRQLEDEIREPQAFTRLELGDLYLAEGNREKALPEYQAAIALAEQAVTARPQDMALRYELADTHERLAAFYELARDWPRAREQYATALATWRDWTKFGVSSEWNLRRERQAVQALARCSRMLKNL